MFNYFHTNTRFKAIELNTVYEHFTTNSFLMREVADDLEFTENIKKIL